tara:strand:+ start:49745 stop:50548 length:804 start_codon:yes stop_codon:yes gene_type:complete
LISLLTLLDDIATTLDDVAVMTKIAIKKTSALMSDDLAVNANAIDGVKPNRELPIVWKIFVGSLLNKVISILGVLAILATYPPLLTIILFVGGLYLSYEGAHKIFEKVQKSKLTNKVIATEAQKIKGAIKTDFILSIEIIVIANNSIHGDLLEKTLTLVTVGLLASILIYGLVAILVKVDDLGLYLLKNGMIKIGNAIIQSMPYAMKGLGIIGTLAMLLVGGGIISHTFHLEQYLNAHIQNLILGFVAGVLIVIIMKAMELIKKRVT